MHSISTLRRKLYEIQRLNCSIMENTATFRFKKLSRHNLTQLKKNIDALIMGKGVYGYVNGMENVETLLEKLVHSHKKLNN